MKFIIDGVSNSLTTDSCLYAEIIDDNDGNDDNGDSDNVHRT